MDNTYCLSSDAVEGRLINAVPELYRVPNLNAEIYSRQVIQQKQEIEPLSARYNSMAYLYGGKPKFTEHDKPAVFCTTVEKEDNKCRRPQSDPQDPPLPKSPLPEETKSDLNQHRPDRRQHLAPRPLLVPRSLRL